MIIMLIMIIPWKMQSTSWTLLLLQLPIRRQLAAAMANLWLYFHNILQYLTIIWNIPIKYILYIYIVLISFTIFTQWKGSAAVKPTLLSLHVYIFYNIFQYQTLFDHILWSLHNWQLFFAIPPHCTISSQKVKSNAFLLNILVPGFQQNVTSGKCSGKSWKLMLSRWIKWNCDIKSGFVGFSSFRAHSQL